MKRSAGAGGDNQASIGRTSESIYNLSKPDIDPECLEHDDSDESQVLQTELINVSIVYFKAQMYCPPTPFQDILPTLHVTI